MAVRELGRDFKESVYADDFFRKCLKQVSAFAFSKTFSEGPRWMLFGHLHALTGKAPFTKEDIEEDISRWVSDKHPDGREKDIDRRSVEETLDDTFASWYHGEPDGALSFKEFCNDFTRWGTSGGGPASHVFDEKYRTKWAWGYEKCTLKNGRVNPDRDVYADSLKVKQYASVALKEEAQKTRAVITAPMSSYLRQAYLLYRWGKPNIPSPISSANWLSSFEKQTPYWYGCVDGDKFDQTIPKWFVYDVIRRLGELDSETRRIAEEEIKSLDTLKVEWRGRYWDYKGGVLSGWRLTSLLGTLASLSAARFILNKTRSKGGIMCGALGDDLILWSNSIKLPHEELVSLYNQFGLTANSKKTTSGTVGEFLRKTVSIGGSWGYPVLGLRTVVYANPWVSNYQFEEETELASTLLTFHSRLIPHRVAGNSLELFCKKMFLHVMKMMFGAGAWEDWYHTPICVGGGGCNENSIPSKWTQLRKIERKQRFTSPETIVPAILGILKSRRLFEPVKRFTHVNFRIVKQHYMDLIQRTDTTNYLAFKKSTSVTDTIFQFLHGQINRRELSRRMVFPLPNSMRGMEPEDIVRALMMPESGVSPISTITHTKETVSGVTGLTNFITKCVARSKRFTNPYALKPLVALYFQQTYREVTMPFGTW
ncbi:MAG: RNA-dependent RNA polymerase [Sanya totivirus 12]|nr:MAG: RNA-dependent RNA polymerase [Sanya totivirus 12]